jgi:hypothetical protein
MRWVFDLSKSIPSCVMGNMLMLNPHMMKKLYCLLTDALHAASQQPHSLADCYGRKRPRLTSFMRRRGKCRAISHWPILRV